MTFLNVVKYSINPNKRWYQFWKPDYIRTVIGKVKMQEIDNDSM